MPLRLSLVMLMMMAGATACDSGDGSVADGGTDAATSAGTDTWLDRGDAASTGDTAPSEDTGPADDAVPSDDGGSEPPASDAAGGAGPDGQTDDDVWTSSLPVAQPLDVPEGGFGVGYTRLSVTYTPDTFDTPRTLEVAVWYPTTDTEGTATSYLGYIARPEVLTDATLAGQALPTVIFSHGNNGIETQSYFLTEELASQGWLVIAPRHTSNSFLDFSQALFPVMFIWRPLDIRTTLDAFEQFAGADMFAGAMSEDVVAAGHSFGGFTTLAVGGATMDVAAVDAACAANPEACGGYWTEPRRALVADGFRDPRIDALVPMAPWRVGGVLAADGTEAIDLPTFLWTATLDETTTNLMDGDPIWSGLAHDDNRRIDFETGGHLTFANACEFGLVEGDGCGAGFIEPSDAFAIINEYSVAFVEQVILGSDRASLLDGIDPAVPDGATLSVP